MLAVLAQLSASAVWLPFVRRWLGTFGLAGATAATPDGRLPDGDQAHLTAARDGRHASRMTRRPVVAVVLVLAVSIGLAVTLSRPAATDRAAEGPDVPSPGRCRVRCGRHAVARSRARPRGLRLRPVLGDGRDDRRPPRGDRPDDDRPLLRHPPQERQPLDGENGYKRITGPTGRRIIAEARDRGARTELVYTSFGTAKNDAFFTNPDARERTVGELVALAGDLGVDGINVDVEQLGIEHIPAYGEFVGRLRTALREANPKARCRSPRRPTSAARRWPSRPAWPARTGSS
jgi:hypothetical protein